MVKVGNCTDYHQNLIANIPHTLPNILTPYQITIFSNLVFVILVGAGCFNGKRILVFSTNLAEICHQL